MKIHGTGHEWLLSPDQAWYMLCGHCNSEILPGESWTLDEDKNSMIAFCHTECPPISFNIKKSSNCSKCGSKFLKNNENFDFGIEIDEEGRDKVIFFHKQCEK